MGFSSGNKPTGIVDTDSSQTLSNKTLDSSNDISGNDIASSSITDPTRLDVKKDIRANLDVYAGTATEGQIVYATDEDKYFGIVNNELVGLGGGISSPSIYKVFNADDDKASDFTASGSGTIVEESVSQLNGDNSFKYSPSAISETCTSPSLSIPQRAFDKITNMCELVFNASHDGFSVEVQDNASNVLASTSITTADTSARLIFNLTGSETSLKFVVKTDTYTAGMNLIFDDVVFDDEPFKKIDTIETGTVRVTGGNGFGSTGTRIRRFSNIRENTGDLIDYVDDSVNGATFTIKRDGVYTLSWYDRSSSGTVGIGFSVNYPNSLSDNIWVVTSEYKRGLEYISAGGDEASSSTSWSGLLSKGDIVRPHGGISGTFNDATEEYVGFTITGTAVNDNVVVENADGSEWTAYTPSNNQGFSSVSNVSFFYRRQGDSVQIMGDLTVGGAQASELQIALPDGLTVGDTAASIKVTGSAHRGDLTATDTHISVLATQGDSFVNFGYRSSGANNWTTPQNGVTMFGAGDTFTMLATVPIEGWSATEAHIIPIADPYENRYWANFDGSAGGLGAITELQSNASGVITCTNTGTGLYTLDYSSLGLASIPAPDAIVLDSNSFNCSITSVSTTQATLNIRNTNSDSDTNRDFRFSIDLGGADYKEPKGYFIGNMVAPRTFIAENTTTGARTSSIPWDNTKPQIGEGEEIASLTFTPSTSKVEVDIQLHYWERTNVSNGIVVGIFKDGAADAVGGSVLSIKNDAGSTLGGGETRKFFVDVTPNVQTTISFRAGSNTGGTWYLNEQDNGGSTLGGLIKSHLKITEIRE